MLQIVSVDPLGGSGKTKVKKIGTVHDLQTLLIVYTCILMHVPAEKKHTYPQSLNYLSHILLVSNTLH